MLDFGFYNMDCMEGMKEFHDKYFDLAIVDPPYGLTKNQLLPGSKISNTGVKRLQYNQKPENLIGNKPDIKYFNELFRISKNQIIWGCNFFENFGPGRLIWNKKNPVLSNAEIAFHSFGIGVYLFEYTWSGFCKAGENNIKRIHPTQKPIELYDWILKNYANPGDKILDTHVGSASSLIACEKQGFQYVGFELDEDYFKAASKRLKDFKSQLTLNFKE